MLTNEQLSTRPNTKGRPTISVTSSAKPLSTRILLCTLRTSPTLEATSGKIRNSLIREARNLMPKIYFFQNAIQILVALQNYD
jgi:hypothetical protein